MKAGWEVKTLGDASTFIMGQAPAGKDCNKDGNGVPFVKAGEFGKSRPIIREWTTDPKKFAKSTDVLICVVGATCGKINLGADCAIGRSAAAIRPIEKQLDQFFLHYFLEGTVQELRAGSLGAAQTVISKDMLSELQIPLPPITEQKRIVSILDEAFEGLDRARGNAEANLKSARELFDESITKTFSKIAEQANKTQLGLCAGFRNGLNYGKSSNGQAIRIVGVGDFQNLYWVPSAGLKTVQIDGQLSQDDLLQEGDILAVRSNGNRALIGRTMLCGPLSEPTSFSGFCIRIRLINDSLLSSYVCYFMKTKALRNILSEGGDGANISNLNQKMLSELEIPIPSTETQSKTVSLITSLEDEKDKLQAHYRSKLQDISDLRQSLLQKAFAGELT